MSVFNILRPTPAFSRIGSVLLSGKRGNFTKSLSEALYSTRAPESKGIMKITLISASVGALMGVGYSGYTHYQINQDKAMSAKPQIQQTLLPHMPDIRPTRRIVSPTDTSNLNLVLFQYQTCPFCCKVRAFLDANGFSYDIVEVDAVLRQSIKWSTYKKVPILLAKTPDGYQQLNDSTAIISVLSSYLLDKSQEIGDLIKCYPIMTYIDEGTGKEKDEILNKYFLMFNKVQKDRTNDEINHERKWRQWADEVLVHTLSPNVYRTKEEAFQAFNWFAEVGEWKKHFPSWECSLMINVGAYAMWIIGKRLKKRHNLKDDVRQSLYDECNNWIRELNKRGNKFMGGESPDLSDLAVYGVLNSIEGCDAFQDLTRQTKISKWFTNMKEHINQNRGSVY